MLLQLFYSSFSAALHLIFCSFFLKFRSLLRLAILSSLESKTFLFLHLGFLLVSNLSRSQGLCVNSHENRQRLNDTLALPVRVIRQQHSVFEVEEFSIRDSLWLKKADLEGPGRTKTAQGV